MEILNPKNYKLKEIKKSYNMRSKTQHVTVKKSDYLLLYRKVWELLTNLYVQRCHVMSQKNERLER